MHRGENNMENVQDYVSMQFFRFALYFLSYTSFEEWSRHTFEFETIGLLDCAAVPPFQ
uniref:Uncharacterized protein n=1 Tax=Arundo donax TaxID=35708 RepID=A0A0A8ZGM8_ARUDO